MEEGMPGQFFCLGLLSGIGKDALRDLGFEQCCRPARRIQCDIVAMPKGRMAGLATTIFESKAKHTLTWCGRADVQIKAPDLKVANLQPGLASRELKALRNQILR